ncbi:hypothetical protein COW36_07090 [bacterium (Candidatus Blackallbacteria) CG17_big_fil_post_rev_8_21_14_2_50_48_46]|uniref:Lipoprotein n=1 Tax=bacterium (Candidatus Blackallbacteria) CG17_big_fil_post_rev_8_21_14_2_50_48_46 TaxID=2014261 RepID=A0A2M7G6Z0_9BACT|nr:MAG: hypothetical protein COW64_06600 [bacterium (Candidatus Blackallbacteria) CG18_big_fil_WC_8_21_14_2_50_49_26]PIW17826.1 MAG: hypothetical protein COW36_07090 [bacterium (Candidatus Blackallbacteria) CG17_big_fil_post_rev_8_21_14_2_50_48_46]PIW48502.1 MAG: hypothetical protein COW20_09045 [bacterium (Candidatus Blackallbacteria) CG13_big_fil_rev_8_21_14_2_50_49_14]
MFKPFATLALGLSLSLNTLALSGCKGKEEKRTYVPKKTEDVSVVANNVGDSLDLSQLPALVRQAKDGEDLEKLLNSSGVNNLDLNQDGNVDYLNVEEFRENGQQGFVLFTNENNQREDIAQVMINKTGQNAEIAVQGSPNYYPEQTVHRSHFPVGEILLAAWLFNLTRPRYYHPPYYFGYYPRYYRGVHVIPRTAYRTRLGSSTYRTRYGSSRPVTSTRSTGRFGSSSFGASSSRTRTTTTTRNGMNQSRNSLSNVNGSSFNRTTNKRPAGSGSTTGSSSFGSSSNRNRSTFGGSSNRSTGSSFGGSSSRSSTGSSGFGSNSSRSRSSSGSSFGSSSSRSRSSSGSSSRRRR